MKSVLILVFFLNALTSFAEHCCAHPSAGITPSSPESAHPCCPESQVKQVKSKIETSTKIMQREGLCGHSCCVSFHLAPKTYFLSFNLKSQRTQESIFYPEKDFYHPVPTPPPNFV